MKTKNRIRRRIQKNLHISEAVTFLRALTKPGKKKNSLKFSTIKMFHTFNLGVGVGEAPPVDGGSVGAELSLPPPEPLEEIPVGVGGGLGGAGLVHNHIVHGQAVQGGKPRTVGGQIILLILKAPLHVTVTRPET